MTKQPPRESLMFDQALMLSESVDAQTELLTVGRMPHRIAVVSGKGGVGKSNIVLNLGIALARDGARVLLVDGNVNLSNLDILSGVSPKHKIVDVLDESVSLKDAITEIIPNVSLLAGSSDGRLNKLASNDAVSLLQKIGSMKPAFHYLVIDTAGGIVQESISLALLSDETFVVSTPEPTAVMDAYILVKVLKRINSSAHLKLVVNRAKSPEEAEEVRKKFDLVIEDLLKLRIDYAGFVPNDSSIEDAVNGQRPLLLRHPASPAAASINSLADQILSRKANK